MTSLRPDRHRLYEAYAPRGVPGAGGRRQPYLDRVVRRHFPRDRSAAILEIGCGPGDLVAAARRAGFLDVRGVDRSPSQVEAAHRRGLADIQKADAFEALRSLPDASLQGLVAFDLFEHLTREELLAMADEAHRVLGAGGRLIIHVPNAESPFFGRVRYGDLTHETAFTPGSAGQLLRNAGFSRCECHEDVPVVHGFKSLLRRAAWSAVRATYALALTAETGERPGGFVLSQNMLVVATR